MTFNIIVKSVFYKVKYRFAGQIQATLINGQITLQELRNEERISCVIKTNSELI